MEYSDILYKISKFPDGQQQINLFESHADISLPGYYYLAGKSNVYTLYPVTIISRLNNFLDLELIICAVKALRNLGIKEIHLYTPYFLGSRSDRQFEEGSNNYLKDVICPIINSLNFDSVTVLDPHSDVLEACLNNFKKVSNLDLVKYSLKLIYSKQLINLGNRYENSKDFVHDKFILVSPDAGASKKIYKIADQIDYKEDIITCSKDRNIHGNLTKTVVPTANYGSKDLIIIDDICDGGATFINIAKEFKKLDTFKGKIYLIVTHGIFSKGLESIMEHFDGIFCTNSYSDTIYAPNITDEVGAQYKIFNQLNIFKNEQLILQNYLTLKFRINEHSSKNRFL